MIQVLHYQILEAESKQSYFHVLNELDPRSSWMGSEQPDLVKICPCSQQGGWARWPLKVSSNPKHSMILWTTISWEANGHY